MECLALVCVGRFVVRPFTPLACARAHEIIVRTGPSEGEEDE